MARVNEPSSLGWALNPHLLAPDIPITAHLLADPGSFCGVYIVFLDLQPNFHRIIHNRQVTKDALKFGLHVL